MQRLTIIGAGLAGVTLARRCQGHMQVTVIEKSRGVAGRMSTRRLDDQVFDHGAQYFTIKDDRFADMLHPYREAGVVAPWDARIVTINADTPGAVHPKEMTSPPMIAAPGMTGLVKAMSAEMDITTGCEAASVVKAGSVWQIRDKEGVLISEADQVITAVPAAQASQLLPQDCIFQGDFDQVQMRGCFTLMLGFDEVLGLGWDAAFVENSLLGFVADNRSRPGRGGNTALTVQTTNIWAEDRLDDPQEEIIAQITRSLDDQLGIKASSAARHRLHRWRYASVGQPLGRPYLYDDQSGLGAIGDWCLRGRVEAAFISATELADTLLK